MREGAKATWPTTPPHGEGRGTTALSLCCKSTDTLGQADENRQGEHVRRRNLWSGITAILRMPIARLYRSINVGRSFEGGKDAGLKNLEAQNC